MAFIFFHFNLIKFDFAIRHEVHSTRTHCLHNADW